MSSRRSTKQRQKAKERCGKITVLQDEEKSVECEICSKWFRAESEALDFEVLARHTKGYIHWYCHAYSDTPNLLERCIAFKTNSQS